MFRIKNNFYEILPNSIGTVKPDVPYAEVKSKLLSNKLKAIYLVNEENELLGVMSKGEILNIKSDWNYSPFFLTIGSKISNRDSENLENYNSIPIVNTNGTLLKILEITDKSYINFNNESFNKFSNPLVIAEIGNNHNGQIKLGKELIKKAKESGANAVKFQARFLEDLYIDLSDKYLNETDFSTSYTVSELKRFNLSFSDLKILFNYSKSLGLIVGCTPFDNKSAQFLIDQQIDFIKIASADMSNYSLLSEFNSCAIPLIISTGMHSIGSIKKLSSWLLGNYMEASLLHVNSTYPTPYEDVNLRFMTTLEDCSTSGHFGYSGHERGFHVPLAALSLGASIIEKHFTLDKKLEGNDHKVSLLPEEMSAMVSQVKNVSSALRGNPNEKKISQGEKLNKIALSKGVYMNETLLPGDSFSIENVKFKSPCVGITPDEVHFYQGKTITKKILKDKPLSNSYFENQNLEYNFPKLSNWGLPVRFRDLEQISNLFKPSFLEYHMFSTDLNIKPHDYSFLLKNKNMSIHAPEQFKDSFVLDLVTDNKIISKKSENFFNKIIEWVENVKEITGQEKINLITNVGGATPDKNKLNEFNKDLAYEKLSYINEMCNSKNINFLPQTMPPFPWHFGGQGFHRLFVDPQDLIESQKWSNLKFCMDFSHTFMSCSHLNLDFYDSLERVNHLFDYMHVADAIYPAEEGIGIGDGNIDFRKLKKYINDKKSQWIPEVWNGHLDEFKGFKESLIKLNNL